MSRSVPEKTVGDCDYSMTAAKPPLRAILISTWLAEVTSCSKDVRGQVSDIKRIGNTILYSLTEKEIRKIKGKE